MAIPKYANLDQFIEASLILNQIATWLNFLLLADLHVQLKGSHRGGITQSVGNASKMATLSSGISIDIVEIQD